MRRALAPGASPAVCCAGFEANPAEIEEASSADPTRPFDAWPSAWEQ